MKKHDEGPDDPEVVVGFSAGRSGRRVAFEMSGRVMPVNWGRVKVVCRQDERQSEVEEKRVEPPEEVEGERDVL